jgi:hypothetical protein
MYGVDMSNFPQILSMLHGPLFTPQGVDAACGAQSFLLLDIDKDVSQWTGLMTPSSMSNGVLVAFVQDLNQVLVLSTTVFPVELANLVIVMK